MIRVNDEIINIEHFPDGTQRLRINDLVKSRNYNIRWIYEKEEELSTLIYITRHLRNNPWTKSVGLTMDYLPNARMDRIVNMEEVFTLKGFTDVINWLNFDFVNVLDVHSNVGAALLNNVIIDSAKVCINDAIRQIELNEKCEALVLYFPDAGAYKRYADMFPIYKSCYGEKKRDWNSGKILGLDIKTNGVDLTGKTILMIDDIIAYGGSLYYSSLELKKHNVGKIYAYATHTENSILDREKGTLIKSLEDGTVEKLFTTDSLFTGKHEKIEVMKLYED